MQKRITYQNQYSLFPGLIELHRLDPLRWYQERWGGDVKDFLWDLHGGDYTSERFRWDGTPNPMATAWKALAMGQNVSLKSATSLGKTYNAARIALWFLDVYQNQSTKVILVGPSASQVKDTLGAELKKIFPKFNQIHLKAAWYDSIRILPEGPGDFDSATWSLSAKSKGVKKAGETANTGPQGIHATNLLFIVDEGAKIEASVLRSIENTVTGTNNLILMLGNPDSIIDPLHIFSQRPNTLEVRASGLDHPNVVLGEEVIPGAVTRQSIVERAGKITEQFPRGVNWDTSFFQSRVRGFTPDQSSDSLIKMAWVNDAIEKGQHGVVGNSNPKGYKVDQWSYNAVGIDVAASETGDKGCVVAGQGNCVNYINQFICPNAGDVAYNLIYGSEEAKERNFISYGIPSLEDLDVYEDNVGIDTVGVGTSTLEVFLHEGYDDVKALIGGQDKEAIPSDPTGKPMLNFQNLRSQMLYTLAMDLKAGEIAISITDEQVLQELKEEAITPKYTISQTAITIERKDLIKERLGRSPNILDALMYWNWVRKDRSHITNSGDLHY